jgi:hypothetical protein
MVDGKGLVIVSSCSHSGTCNVGRQALRLTGIDREAHLSSKPKEPGGRASCPTPSISNTVSTIGLESSPVAAALAGLRANEARYFKNKYDHVFTTEPASAAKETVDWVHRILKEERDIVISSRPLEATEIHVENIRWVYVFYEKRAVDQRAVPARRPEKRAVGFKLSEGMDVPEELASKFKFARQKSRLAGTIRGSYFVLKNEY